MTCMRSIQQQIKTIKRFILKKKRFLTHTQTKFLEFSTRPDPTRRNLYKQVAQLSQRDRAAGWVSNGEKWKTGTERQYLRTM